MKILLLMISFISLFAVDASMEIVKKNAPKIGITLHFLGDESLSALISKIEVLLKKDLDISNNFEYIDSTEKGVATLGGTLEFKHATTGAVECLLNLTESKSKKKILSKSYTFNDDEKFPFLAHKITIDINNKLDAPSIDWMQNMLIFVEYKGNKNTDISISDYTLGYKKTIFKGGLNLFAKWANKEHSEFYYSNLDGHLPALYKYNIYSGKKEKIYESNGMIVCSDISQDGKSILVTMSPEDQPDIYLFNLENKTLQRLTDYKGIDVNGRFVENDTKIVFLSDRLKQTAVFIKNATPDKIVSRFVDTGSANNSVTTRGDKVAFVAKESSYENRFNIYLASTKSLGMGQLTSSGSNEFPRFSQDADSLLYMKEEGGQSYIGLIRLSTNKSYLFAVNHNKIQSLDW
jgi:TolB protein